MTENSVNPDAITPLAFSYPIHRRKYLRNHTNVDHKYETPIVIAIDPEMDGVAP